MLEIWTEAELEDLVLHRERVHCSRSSVVNKLQLKDKRKAAEKLHRPDPSDLKKRELSLGGKSFHRGESHYFLKEAILCKDLPPLVDLIAVVPETLKTVTEWADGIPFHDLFIEMEQAYASDIEEHNRGELIADSDRISKGARLNQLNERFLDHLAHFYDETADISDMARKSIFNKKSWTTPSGFDFKVRSRKEHERRQRSYLLKLVYGLSEEFKSRHPEFYYPNVPTRAKDRKRKWAKAKRRIKSHLASKRIIFNEFVNEYLYLYNKLVYGEETYDKNKLLLDRKLQIIHGDFISKNVMYNKGKMGEVLDPNECRVDKPHHDVVAALSNFVNRPSESRVPRLVEYIWQRSFETDGYPDYKKFFIGTLATRVVEDIRIASTNITYTDEEINNFTEGHPRFDTLCPEERAYQFRRDRIDDLRSMIAYYTYGGGYSQLQHCDQKRVTDLMRFLDLTNRLISCLHIGAERPKKYIGKPVRSLGLNNNGVVNGS